MHFSTIIVSVLATLAMATPMEDGNGGDIEKRGVCGNGILKKCLMLVVAFLFLLPLFRWSVGFGATELIYRNSDGLGLRTEDPDFTLSANIWGNDRGVTSNRWVGKKSDGSGMFLPFLFIHVCGEGRKRKSGSGIECV